jgi:hypothetical protein
MTTSAMEKPVASSKLESYKSALEDYLVLDFSHLIF